MSTVLIKILQAILFLLLAPMLSGWIKMLKCLFQNRTSPSVFQPYRNLLKLFVKQTMVPKGASWIFRFAPYLVFSTVCLSSFIIPLFYIHAMAVDSSIFAIGDVIVLIGIFALGRFFLVLAGMDIGTAFGGMGSSREMMISALVEPTTLLVMLVFAMITASTNLSIIMERLLHTNFIASPSLIFALLGFMVVILAETGRIPVDNPTTHLELTMVHEAMILEYSGKYLALIEWASQIKLMLYFALIANLFFPFGMAAQPSWQALSVGFFVVISKMMTLGLVLSVIETSLAKMRLFKVPYFLGLAFVLCLLALLSRVVLGI